MTDDTQTNVTSITENAEPVSATANDCAAESEEGELVAWIDKNLIDDTYQNGYTEGLQRHRQYSKLELIGSIVTIVLTFAGLAFLIWWSGRNQSEPAPFVVHLVDQAAE